MTAQGYVTEVRAQVAALHEHQTSTVGVLGMLDTIALSALDGAALHTSDDATLGAITRAVLAELADQTEACLHPALAAHLTSASP